MRIKFHPATIIEIYPDERVEIFFGEPRYFLDKFKIRLIESTLRNSKERLVERFPPGIYRFHATNYNWVKQKTKFALKIM
jgi:hypothetical protein